MSLKQHLEKRKKQGIIDFIEVPLDYGRSHKEFVGYDLKYNSFFRLFYDNKYREDKVTPNIEKIVYQIEKLKKESFGSGIYNNEQEIKEKQKILDFIKKYQILCKQ